MMLIVESKPAPATMLTFQFLPVLMEAKPSKMRLLPASRDSNDGAVELPGAHFGTDFNIVGGEKVDIPVGNVEGTVVSDAVCTGIRHQADRRWEQSWCLWRD